MQYKKYLERIKLLDRRIKTESTGGPEDLAKILGVSRRMVFYYLEYYQAEFELELEFCRKIKSYRVKLSKVQ